MEMKQERKRWKMLLENNLYKLLEKFESTYLLTPFLVTIFSNWRRKKNGNFILRASEYYGEEMKNHTSPFVLRQEEGSKRDIVQEILDWTKNSQKILILTGENGCGKSRTVIEAAKRKEMRWIQGKGWKDSDREGKNRMIKEGFIYILEDEPEYNHQVPELLDLIFRKKAMLLLLTSKSSSLRVELKWREESFTEIRFKPMENIHETILLDDAEIRSRIGKISEGNLSAALLALEFFKNTKSIDGIEDCYGLLNMIYKNIEEKMPESLPLLGKTALARGIEAGSFPEARKVQGELLAGQIIQQDKQIRILPVILREHFAKRFYFIPFVRDKLESTIEEFIPTKAREMLASLISIKNREGCKIILEKAKSLDPKTVLDLGFSAFLDLEDSKLVVEHLEEFWNRVWELENPLEYNHVAHLLYWKLFNKDEAIRCWEEALSLSDKIQDIPGKTQISNHLADAYRRNGNVEKAIQIYEKSLIGIEESDDLKTSARQHSNLGSLFLQKENFIDASTSFEKALEAYQKLGDHEGLVETYRNLASVNSKLGSFNKAVAFYEKSLVILEHLEDIQGMAQIFNHLAIVYRGNGEWEKAIEYYEKNLGIAQKMNDDEELAQSYGNIAQVYMNQDIFEKALYYYYKSLDIKEKIGDLNGIAGTYSNIAQVYFSQGEWESTAQHYEKSLLIKEKLEDIHGMAKIYNNLGLLFVRKGDLEDAVRFYEKSLSIKERFEDIQGMAKTYNNLGSVYGKIGDFVRAVQCYEKDLTISKQLGDNQGMAQTHGNMGILYMEDGRLAEAEDYLLKSLSAFTDLDDRTHVSVTLDALQSLISIYRNKGDKSGFKRVKDAIGTLSMHE
jgi:tetratricopeptide (TPR) repeat protein